MNISGQIFPDDGLNSSDYLFCNGTVLEKSFSISSVVNIIIVLVNFPINSYVIWLIVTGTGNGLAAEFFSLDFSVCEIFICVESLFSHFMREVKTFSIPLLFLEELAFTGRTLFQCLICVERYLAVVHPVTFLKYKPLRYRVICSVIAWVASFVSGGVNISALFLIPVYFTLLFAQFFMFFSIQLFCLVAVLRALKQSGPGERAREREENHIKKRAFYIILITTLTMLIMYAPYILVVASFISGKHPEMLLLTGFLFFTLAGLVQPVLFLYRVKILHL